MIFLLSQYEYIFDVLKSSLIGQIIDKTCVHCKGYIFFSSVSMNTGQNIFLDDTSEKCENFRCDKKVGCQVIPLE